MAAVVQELVDRYKKFIADNAESVGQAESAARVLAYLVPGGYVRAGLSSPRWAYSAAVIVTPPTANWGGAKSYDL